MIHLRTAWNSIKRSPFQATAAIFVLSLTFFVITLLSTLVYSSSQVIKHFETRPEIIAFLKADASSDEIAALQGRLQNDSRVKTLSYVSQEEALEIYKKATQENPLLSELVNPSVFPASLEISLTELAFAENIIEEIKSEAVVEDVGFTASLQGESSLTDVVERLKNVAQYLRVGGGFLAAFLAGTSFLVLVVIISMRMTMRRGEIEILKLIGATTGFIRNPILLEAVIYTTIGTLLGWVMALLVILFATPTMLRYFADIPILPRDTVQLISLFGLLLIVELGISLFLAISGSMIAVSRARKR